jgi:hypothetical protein
MHLSHEESVSLASAKGSRGASRDGIVGSGSGGKPEVRRGVRVLGGRLEEARLQGYVVLFPWNEC